MRPCVSFFCTCDQEAAEENARKPVAASAPVVSRVAHRDEAAKERHLRGAAAAAKARARREKMVAQSRTKPPKRRDVRSALYCKAGVVLVRSEDGKARRKADVRQLLQTLSLNVTGQRHVLRAVLADLAHMHEHGLVPRRKGMSCSRPTSTQITH